MKKYVLKFALLVFVMGIVSCSKDDDTPDTPGVTSYEVVGAWDCELGDSCEDLYEFDFKAGTKISISIEEIDGSSVVSLDLSLHIAGTNILTNGDITYYGCTGQDESVALANILLNDAGKYHLKVARDWGLSAGADGNYKLTIIADTPFEAVGLTADDDLDPNYERECL